MLPDLTFLKSFVAVYDAGSVTRAATALHRTQPTVTYQLRRLEAELRQPLFVRHAGHLTPTRFGERLYRVAVRLATELEDLQAERQDSRPLALAAVSGFGRHVLFPLLLAPPFDGVPVELRLPSLDDVIARAEVGAIDAGFVYRATTHARLIAEPVFEEALVLVAGAAWRRRLRTPRDFEDVAVVTYDESDYVFGRWLGHHFGRRHPRWYSASHFDELEEVLAAVAAGRGVAVVPSFCLRAARGVGIVGWDRRLRNTIYAVRPAHVPARAAVVDLVTAVRRLRSGR
jgi:LysR family transcriptional regulator, cyn operon transcriptional activator